MAAGHEAAVKALVYHGADLTSGHILNKVVEEMCEIDPSKIPPEDPSDNPSAARYGAGRMIFLEEVFHAMVAQEKKEDLDDVYEDKTPLRRAIEDVHDDLPFGQAAVSALIDAGADVNKNNVFYWTVHNLCQMNPASGPRYEGLFKITKMLVTNQADVNKMHNNKTPLSLALETNNKEVIKLLTDHGALLGPPTLYNVMSGQPIDQILAFQIIKNIVDKRLEGGAQGASLDYSKNGMTPLKRGISAVCHAVARPNMTAEQSKFFDHDLVLGDTGILLAGADTNIGAPFNFCLQELAKCKAEDRDFLEKVGLYLLEQEANVDSNTQHGFEQAVDAQSYIAFIIIQEKKAQHNDLFNVLTKLIHLDDQWSEQSVQGLPKDEVKDYLDRVTTSLITAGIGIKMVRDNQTAFTLSIESSNYNFVDSLIEKKCNIHDGYPFHKALNSIPLAQGNQDRIEFLHYALEKLLLETDSINECLREGGLLNTPLTLAIRNNAQEFTNILLERGDLDKNLCNPLVVALNEVNKLGDDEEHDEDTPQRLDFLFEVIDKLLNDKTAAGSELTDDNGQPKSILIMAIETGRYKLVKRILDSLSSEEALKDMVNFLQPLGHCLAVFEDPHSSAAKRQSMEEMSILLLAHHANPDIRVGQNQEPALTVAAQAGRQRLTQDMISHIKSKDSFDAQDKDGRPAIHRFLHWLKECKEHDIDRIVFLETTLVQLIDTVNQDSLNVLINGQSPLDIALQCNNKTVTAALLSHNAEFGPSALVDSLKELLEAGSQERFKMMEFTACELIKNGADVNLGIGELYPINLTFNAGSADVFEAMLEKGLDLHGADGKPFAQTIAAEVAGLQIGAEDVEHRVAFLKNAAVALSQKDPSVFHEILDSTKASSDFAKDEGMEICRVLIECGIAVDAPRESDGATPLHCAASAGASSLLSALLEQKDRDHFVDNFDVVNHFNQTPLIYAAIAGHLDCVCSLLDCKADPSIAGGLYLNEMTALHEAALLGDPDICQVLVDAHAPVDAKAYWERTPLHLAVVGGAAGQDSGRLNCVEVLIQGGCDVNALDLDAETGLSYAVERDYHDVSAALLAKGADPCGADIHGTTPIHHCVENHNVEIFQSLLDNKPDAIEKLGLLAPCIRAGFRPGIEPLAQACGDINKTDSLTGMIATANIGGWLAPLWNACYFGQHAIAESFLAQVTDINLKDHAQFTLLHRLIHWGGRHHTEFITTLLNAGASPDVRDRNNRSALQVATRLGNAAAAQALTHGGADVSEEDVTVAKDAKDPALHLMIGGPSNLPSIDDRSSFENAHRWCSEHNAKFLDSSFQPCLGSLVDVTDNSKLPGRYHDVEWVRAGEACKGNFSGAFDVTAGPLGDPFFIATLPDTPDSAFPHQMSESEFGLYEVTVQWMGETKTVLVDDFVPAIEGKPISAFSESGMMWPLIYEKACAKVAGSYQALSALRHGEKTIVERHTQKTSMPDRMQASSRRQYEVEKFMSPCLSAAMLGGFASNDQALASFASEFGDRSKVDRSKMLDGESRPMTTVGNFDMMQFPIKSPTKMVKVTSDTQIRAECSYSASAAGTCTVALCVVELVADAWRLVKASVSTAGQTAVVVETTLTARGNKYLVFVGTPTNKTGNSPDLHLAIDSDMQMEIMDH